MAIKKTTKAEKATKKTAAPTTTTSTKACKPMSDLLKKTLANINSKSWAGTIALASDVPEVEFISTGVASVDFILWGGIAKGRVVEYYGAESSGKTSLALTTVASAQKEGKRCVFIDMECTFDPVFATNLGVDISSLIVAKPECWEQAFELLKQLAATGEIDLVVVDSVPALVTMAELEGEVGDIKIAPQAVLLSKALRQVIGVLSKMNVTVILINQIRTAVGQLFGNPEQTAGGRALKFYLSQRLRISRVGKDLLGENKQVIGHTVRFHVEKNKVAPPKRTIESSFYYKWGFDKIEAMVDALIAMKVITSAGAYYSLDFDGELIKTCGKEKMKEAFMEKDEETLNKFFAKQVAQYNQLVLSGKVEDDTKMRTEELEDFDMNEISDIEDEE